MAAEAPSAQIGRDAQDLEMVTPEERGLGVVARSERTEPPPASDGSARDLSGSVENAQIWVHVILRHVKCSGSSRLR